MKEDLFKTFLIAQESITSKIKGVNSRMSKARSIEKKFNVNLDEVATSDNKTFLLLLNIKVKFGDKNGSYQNSARYYYLFKNGRRFPSLDDYK